MAVVAWLPGKEVGGMKARKQTTGPIDWAALPLAVPTPEASRITGLSESFFNNARNKNLKNRLKGPPYFRDGKLVLYKVKDLKTWLDGIETFRAV